MGDYIKRTWKDNEPITVEKLNNIETGIVEAKKEAENGTIAKQVAEQAKTIANSKATAPIISQTDITAGQTPLAAGQSYHVYE